MIEKIISGGQTGADRAALDVAIRHGLPHGGWCPRGRKAEDGRISREFHLAETPSADYSQRTEWNVCDADGTVVFTLVSDASAGSLRTLEFAMKHGKPSLHLSRSGGGGEDSARTLQKFVEKNRIAVLNVAGSRESEEPGIYQWVTGMLENAFF
jgi:hypothetical protein